MTWSLNETEALCRKAARGAGMPWGLAEEAGRAARWLEDHGLDGAACLAAILPEWPARQTSGTCPILIGAAILDSGQLPDVVPMQDRLLWPFLAAAAALNGDEVRLGSVLWIHSDGTVVVDGQTHATRGRAAPLPATVQTLEHFAKQTYAPATEASRNAGAGAGTSDND